MPDSPDPVGALRRSHQRLSDLVAPLSAADLAKRSFCSGWSLADALSHLGSQAENLGSFLSAAIAGEPEPTPDTFPAVWDRWDALSPVEQRAAYVEATDLGSRRIGQAAAQHPGVEVSMFGGYLTVTPAGFAQLRLFEHAVHSWDIAVALDPAATIHPEPVALIVDELPNLMRRFANEEAPTVVLRLIVRDPDRAWVLTSGKDASITDWAGQAVDAAVELTGEQLVRLISHRLTKADDVDIDGTLSRAELEAAFPPR